MKKIFFGVTNILLIVMTFTYLLIGCIGSKPILFAVSYTGLPVIGFIFLLPSFVLTILDMSISKNIIHFLASMFSLFAGVFILASTLFAFFTETITAFYVPIILLVVTVLMTSIALTGVIKELLNERKKKSPEKKNHEEEMVS